MAYEDHEDFDIYGEGSIENWGILEKSKKSLNTSKPNNYIYHGDFIDDPMSIKNKVKTVLIVLAFIVFFYFILK